MFYKPKDAWLYDVIPFYEDGKFYLFHLHDWRNKKDYGEGIPWYMVSTTDFVNFKEHGEMLARGKKSEQDLYVFTGSVIKVNSLYHIFYTGHNPYFQKKGKHKQAIMHAVSKDLLNWEKILEDTFYADEGLYEKNDWRDPFVFWNEEKEEYWMLLAARLKTGLQRRRGCIALCTSKNLCQWKIEKPFWAPNLYYTHEVPDLFKIGDLWYLVYSTFSEKCVTHYRMSRNLNGPWSAPVNDTFDGRAYYAAKTVSDGKKRYAFGWNPTRNKEEDYNYWESGGNLVVHEIIQNKDGSLSVMVPDTVNNYFDKKLNQTFSIFVGDWKYKNHNLSVDSKGCFSLALAGRMPSCCRISVKIKFDKNTRGCGVMISKNSENPDKAYYIRLEPLNNRMVFDIWPRQKSKVYEYLSDNPFMVELERPIELKPGKIYELKVFIDGTICEAYLNNEVVMSARMYDLKSGRWGFFVSEGVVEFTNMKLMIHGCND